MKKALCQPVSGGCSQRGLPCPDMPRRQCGIVPSVQRELPVARPALLGDRIESALTSIGVTKDRWAWFVGQFGTPPTGGCGGCDKRQEVLNDADLWMRHAASELGSAAVTAISKVWA